MSEIVVMGAGLMGSHHLTLETVAELQRAEVVFHLVTGLEAVRTLARLNPNLYSMMEFYREGAVDLEVYSHMVSYLLAQALAHRRIGFVVMGHPSIYVAPTHLLLEHGPRYGVQVRVLAALSTLDVLLSSLPFDIANTGLQVLDANRLVAYALEPQRNVPLLLFQAGCFGSGIITRMQQNHPERLRPLVDYLQRFYPLEHPTEIVECEMGWPHRAVRLPLPLNALAQAGHLVTYNTTLYLPACEQPEVRNLAFQEQLLNPQAVASLVAEQ
jgi:precorrin-6B methylase 1